MGKIIVSEFMSLDGVIENPGWSFKYWNDEINQFKADEDAVTDALLLGRVTYEQFAAVWPTSKDEGAARINSVPKYVVSTTLDKVEWNNSRLVKGDAVTELAKLKQDGVNMLVYGSGTLVQTLIRHNLVDSVRLLVYPLVLGEGQRLIAEGTTAALNLVESRTLTGGVLALVYEPERQ